MTPTHSPNPASIKFELGRKDNALTAPTRVALGFVRCVILPFRLDPVVKLSAIAAKCVRLKHQPLHPIPSDFVERDGSYIQ